MASTIYGDRIVADKCPDQKLLADSSLSSTP
jgi:hypothetical protein